MKMVAIGMMHVVMLQKDDILNVQNMLMKMGVLYRIQFVTDFVYACNLLCLCV